jgi:hypothetical protein
MKRVPTIFFRPNRRSLREWLRAIAETASHRRRRRSIRLAVGTPTCRRGDSQVHASTQSHRPVLFYIDRLQRGRAAVSSKSTTPPADLAHQQAGPERTS